MKKELNKTKGVFVKNSKMSLARSTTALSCLIGSLIISSESVNALTTATGSFTASTSIATVCTISAGSMVFVDYVPASPTAITADSVVTANCTAGTTYTISFADTPPASPGSPKYLLTGPSSNTLEITFTNNSGQTMTNGAATITGTGTGVSAPAGTITGRLGENQTGKVAGTYSKIMTLNIVY